MDRLITKAHASYSRPSRYGVEPRKRAADLPGMVGLDIAELFPDIPKAIYVENGDLAPVRKATEEALKNTNMSMIKPEHTVNILTSQYGYQLMGAFPYIEMIKTIKEIVEQRTGCHNIRLRVATGFRLREPEEIIKHYKLDEMFDGKAKASLPVNKGIEIETEIGTLVGIANIYDADWIIHAHHGELRELDMHRMLNRAIKPFSMSYARMETRGVHHMNFGPRSSNILPQMMFESEFVQSKFTFGCFMGTSPQGVIGIYAGNNMYEIDRKLMLIAFKSYGKIRELYNEIKECIVIMDATGEPRYMIGGGTTFGNLTEAELDLFDLDKIPVSLGYGLYEKQPGPKIKSVNPSIKAMVMNHGWIGVPQMELPTHIPTFIVGRELAKVLDKDPMNHNFMRYVAICDVLETAMEFARRTARTDYVIAFDGAFGTVTCSESLAKHLIERAPAVVSRVDDELMPIWLRQRGFDPATAYASEAA